MTLIRKVLAAGALTIFSAFPISGAFAQSAGPMGDNGASASAPAQSAQVDDATLQKAAKAYVKVKEIVHQDKAANSGANAQPANQSDKLNAVRDQGLNPQQYNQIIQMVQNDPQLQQKFAGYVNQNGGDAD
jgi:Domain of unknown function (DUF4168)